MGKGFEENDTTLWVLRLRDKIDRYEKCFFINQTLIIHRREGNCRIFKENSRNEREVNDDFSYKDTASRLKHHHIVLNNLSIMFASSAAVVAPENFGFS